MTFGNLNIKLFEARKREFQALKNSKLAFVAHKHVNDNFPISDLWQHLQEEIQELNEIKAIMPTKELIDELVDVSNMLDFLYFSITSSYFYHFDGTFQPQKKKDRAEK